MTTRRTLYFARPYKIEVRDEPPPDLGAQQVLVQTAVSAISAGTELLFYRGQIPAGMAIDATIAGLDKPIDYPLSYGYACAGKVIATGPEVDPAWLGRRVFAFHPHTSAFVCAPSDLLPIPDALSFEQAVFLPNMETALNLVMDARPVVGERVIVLGLGVVGLLTFYLLRQFPLIKLSAIDAYAKRKTIAASWGAEALFSPGDTQALAHFDPDLILELSSNPDALATALQLAAFGTRIIVGSWYGSKLAHLPLGGSFHRNRIQIISSQVSTLDGQFTNRWSKSRRLDLAWAHLHNIPVDDLITHRLPITEASQAYQMLEQNPEQAIQVLLTY
ncbi:MAG: zinc-binding alcohol dehydrogenase [Caldilineaceae bacterium]|nr:zinc-binding alcohol dehydrogenase [Caldilineaceae bacterium]